MAWWKIFRSNKPGKQPTVNDIDLDTIAVNRVDGKLFFKKKSESGVESIVEITGGSPGTGDSHLRAHQIDSPDDHPAAPAEKRGKYLRSNPTTGAIELVDLPAAAEVPVAIPRLKMSFGHYRAAGTNVKKRDELFAEWDSDDDTFLDYNPEIWTFRKKNNFRRQLVSEHLGDELCLDTECERPETWITTGAVVVADGVIAFTNAAYGDSISQILSTSTAIPWAWYELTFTVSGYVKGHIKASYSNGVSAEVNANGTYTFRLRRTSQNAGISFTAYGASGTTLRIDNVSFTRVWRQFNLSHKKKWAHEPHLNGIKYPESKYWAGETKCKVAAIEAAGRNTEFELTAGRYQKQLIELDPYEYIYAQHKVTDEFFKLSDSTDLSTIKALEIAGKKTLSVGFRFAIVIDHPGVEGEKLIGDLSDEVFLSPRYTTNGLTPPLFLSLLFRYRFNPIIFKV